MVEPNFPICFLILVSIGCSSLSDVHIITLAVGAVHSCSVGLITLKEFKKAGNKGGFPPFKTLVYLYHSLRAEECVM